MKQCLLLVLAASIAACGWGYADARAERAKASGHADAPEAQVLLSGGDCSDASGDSAQAVCLATQRDLDSAGPTPATVAPRQVFEVVRRGETICVHTGLAGGLDGEERVSVVRGAVVARIQTDSTGCR